MYNFLVIIDMEVLRASQMVQWQRIHLSMQEMWVQSLGGEDLLEKDMATHSSILAWESHGQRSLTDYRPWGHKESGTSEQHPYHGGVKFY